MDSFLTPYGLWNSGVEKLQVTYFGCGIIESHNFFVLGPMLVKFHIRTRQIESFPTIFRTWWCGQEKLHFTPFHTLPTEPWRSADSNTWEGRRVLREVRLGNCTQIWGLGQIWRAWDSRLRKNSTSHLFWLVQTCPDLRTIQWPCMLVSQSFFCTFKRSYSSAWRPVLVKLHILTRLIKSFPMVHWSWSCIEIEMLIPLGAHA